MSAKTSSEEELPAMHVNYEHITYEQITVVLSNGLGLVVRLASQSLTVQKTASES